MISVVNAFSQVTVSPTCTAFPHNLSNSDKKIEKKSPGYQRRYRLTKGFGFLCGVLSEHVKATQRVSLETKVYLCTYLNITLTKNSDITSNMLSSINNLYCFRFFARFDYQRLVGIANAFSQETTSKYICQVTKALIKPPQRSRTIHKIPDSERRKRSYQKPVS